LTAGMATIERNAAELGRLDAVAADGDHGMGMSRGMRAAVAAARDVERAALGDALGAALLAAGTAFADAAGGASGALYGVLLAETGAGIRRGGGAPTATTIADAVAAAAEAFTELGGAQVGDKTMLDAIEPFR